VGALYCLKRLYASFLCSSLLLPFSYTASAMGWSGTLIIPPAQEWVRGSRWVVCGGGWYREAAGREEQSKSEAWLVLPASAYSPALWWLKHVKPQQPGGMLLYGGRRHAMRTEKRHGKK